MSCQEYLDLTYSRAKRVRLKTFFKKMHLSPWHYVYNEYNSYNINWKGGEYMAQYIINFPDDLHKEAKIRAAQEGTTLKEIIIKAVKTYLEKGGD